MSGIDLLVNSVSRSRVALSTGIRIVRTSRRLPVSVPVARLLTNSNEKNRSFFVEVVHFLNTLAERRVIFSVLNYSKVKICGPLKFAAVCGRIARIGY